MEVHRLTLTTEDQKRELFEDAADSVLKHDTELVSVRTNIRIADPNFLKGTEHPDVKSFSLGRYLKSEMDFVGASVNEGLSYVKYHLWKAWVLDPDIDFPLVFYFAKKDMKIANELKEGAVSRSSLELFHGVVPNISRIEGILMKDKSEVLICPWDEGSDGKPTTRIVLKHARSMVGKVLGSPKRIAGKNNSMASDLSEFVMCEYSYWPDKHDLPRLLRPEKLVPGKFLLLYEMNSFDENDFPRF